MTSTISTKWIRTNGRLEKVQVSVPEPTEQPFGLEDFSYSSSVSPVECWLQSELPGGVMITRYNEWLSLVPYETSVEVCGFAPQPTNLPLDDWRQPCAGERIMMAKYNKWLNITPK